MERDQALELLSKHIKNPNMIKHSLASERVMMRLAERLGYDPRVWGLAGLLHDIDVEEVGADLSRHTKVAEEILERHGLPAEVVDAVKMHNEIPWGQKRSKPIHHALAASENLTGLITALALVLPDKRLSSVSVRSVLKRMKEKKFAQGANREAIMECEKLGLPLEEFVSICLSAMQEISKELGL